MAEGTVAADQLRLFVERIERLEEEKKAISDDIRDVYAELKANGYDTKITRKIVALRKLETHMRQEQDALLDTYREALGIGSGGSGGMMPRTRQDQAPTALERAIEERLVEEGYTKNEDGAWRAPLEGFANHLDKMDRDGIGVSISVAGGPEVPLNETARTKAEERAPTSIFDLDEERYAKAVGLIAGKETVSPSSIQGALTITYEAAARYLAKMETEGIVGPANALERRDVLQRAAA